MGWRRSHNFRGLPEHGCSCLHVFLLLYVEFWTQCTKVSVVEKVRDLSTQEALQTSNEYKYFRYITTMQLVQFATFFIHATFPIFIDCEFPKEYSYVILFHGAMFFILFLNFYIQSYIKKDGRGSSNGISQNNGSTKKVA